jgi:putative ABC transport system permease protein
MIRQTVRRLLRQPAAPLLAVITLALGLAISTALFTVTRDVVLAPFPFRDQERLIAVWSNIPSRGVPHLELTLAEYEAIRDRAKSIEDFAVISAANFNAIITGREPVNVSTNFASRSFYRMLGVQAEHGRVFSEAEHKPNAPKVALISHRLWTSRFGAKTDILGKPIDVEGDKFTVIGVLPRELNVPPGADLIIPLEPFFGGGNPDDRHNSVLEGIGRLKKGVALEAAVAEFNTLATDAPEQYEGVRKHAVPLVDELLGSTAPAMKTLFVMALLVLAIATFNAASIFVARAVARQRDFAIRVAIGASRGALLREILTETLLISLTAAVFGFLLARTAVAALVRFGPSTIPRLAHAQVSFSTYVFAAAAAILIAVICAVVASFRTGGLQGLREGVDRGHAALRSRRLLTTLAAVQLAVAVVLLVGAGLMIRSFLTIASIDTGFSSSDRVLTAHLPLPSPAYADAMKRKQFFTNVVERLRRMPGVEAAGAALMRPLEIELGWDWAHTVEGQGVAEHERNPMANIVSVTPGYFEAMGVPLLRGRLFNDRDTDKATPMMIVGKSFAMRHWGTLDVIGKRVKQGKPDAKTQWKTIVGVVADVRQRGLTIEKQDVYFPYLQTSWTPQYVALRTSTSKRDAEAMLRAVVKEIDPSVPVSSVRTTEELIDEKLAQPRLHAWILATFASVALLLSIIGVYAVLSYAVRNRTTELGVRLALGAHARDLLGMVLRDAAIVSVAAAAAGCVAALLLTRFLGGFLYGVSRAEPMTLALAVTIVVAAALLGSMVPAVRAARTNPVVALRDE